MLHTSDATDGLPHVVCGVNATCVFTGEMANEIDSNINVFVMLMSLCAMASFTVGSLLHRCDVLWLPESLVVIFLGACLGGALYTLPGVLGSAFELNMTRFQLLFGEALNLALPIIIFESGWTLRRRDFTSQLGYIMLLAILGTIICILVVAALIMATTRFHNIDDWRTAVAYAALISSVDPVATLSTFGRLNVDPLLFILVFGESQINDAVAITLFEAVNENGLENVGVLASHMAITLFGSIGLGVGLALVYLIVIRVTRMRDAPSCAVLFILCSCIFTYCLGELLTRSGIITVLFNSIVMGAYSGMQLSGECISLISFIFKQLSSLMDTHIFMFCGVCTVLMTANATAGTLFGFWIVLFCMLGRAAAVIPLGLLSNGIKMLVRRHLPAESKHMITPSHLFMLWHSGLRGGVSLVLALRLGDWVNDVNPGMKNELVNATFVMVCVYLVVFGSSTAFFLKLTGLPLGDQVSNGTTLYTPGDKSGLGYKLLQQLRHRVISRIVESRGLSDPDDHPDDHIVEDCLREAEEEEERQRHGSSDDVLRESSQRARFRRNSSHDAGDRPERARASSRFELYGTTDPCLLHDKTAEETKSKAAANSLAGRCSSGAMSDITESECSKDDEGDESCHC